MKKTIMGIDPGTNEMGLGFIVYEDKKEPYYFDILFKPNRDNTLAFVQSIYDEIKTRCTGYGVEFICVERMFMSRSNKHLSKLNIIQDIVEDVAEELKIPIKVVSNSTMKKQMGGHGKADKEIVRQNVEKIVGFKIDNLNISDAFGIALCWNK